MEDSGQIHELVLESHTTHSSHPASGRRQRRQQETRERLYQSAMKLFAEGEFHEVTVEQITEAADVGKGTFFNYFSNKEAIVRYRFERQFEMLAELLREEALGTEEGALGVGRLALGTDLEVSSNAPTPQRPMPNASSLPNAPTPCILGGPVWRRMVLTMHTMMETDAHSKQLVRNLLALGLVNDEVRRANLHVHERIQQIAEHLIIAGQRSGELRDDISAREMGDYLRGFCLNLKYQWAETDDNGGEDIHAVIDRNLRFLWSSLRHPQFPQPDRQS